MRVPKNGIETTDQRSYKQLLQARMEALKESRGLSVTYQRMAEACGIQKTYLSRLFHDEKTHLSADQLYLAMRFLEITGEEAEFTELLWNWERAGNPERRKNLRSKIDALLKERLKAETVVQARRVNPTGTDAFHDYYLDPFQQLVHVFLMIPRYRDNPEAIGRKLGLSPARLSVLLKKLLKLGVVEETGKGYRVTQMRLHLSPDSAVYYPYRALMRLRSLDLMQRRSQAESYGVSVLFTGTSVSREKVQTKFLRFLKEIEADVKGDPDEEVFQLNFDLVSWTE